MLKKLCIALGIAGAALALAVTIVQGAKGRGVAINDHNVAGKFTMDVKKVRNGERVEVGGGMVWESRGNEGAVYIEMRRAAEFGKDGSIARFAGPARAVFTHNGVRRILEGRLAVMVNDTRNHVHPEGPPDAIALKFISPRMNVPYVFEGKVHDGDISVYELSR